jgi:hypothetical protein
MVCRDGHDIFSWIAQTAGILRPSLQGLEHQLSIQLAKALTMRFQRETGHAAIHGNPVTNLTSN